MPVEPIPCASEGGGSDGACACAPSIATTPLCRADGTSVLVVLRSECATCGDPASDPAVIGWVDPTTGAFTPGVPPADAAPCAQGCSCSPSIATTALCRADGTSVLVVVRSDCTDCDTPAANPSAVGWIDPLTGVFTPGAAPADVVPCEALTCVDTICRQLCDDTDGDGAADATYSELWCIRADGSAELVLTYQDDPSVPYTPTAPVDCTYGCPTTETIQLCDDAGAFLRRYTWLNGLATYEDFALDGMTPHVVTGTVGACSSSSPSTEPECVDTVCRTRCDDTDGDGEPDAVFSELWCVQADGTAELVLTYQDDPSTPYTPTAPVDCTYASQATETLTLCDDTGPFLRRYNWLGDTASFEDVDLDGTTPHVVTGTVGVCPAASACDAQTTPAATLGLCLADGTPIAVVVTRDCDGVVTGDGWLNLTTGAWSAGQPPAGTVACGASRSIQMAGTFCDVDVDGTVLGLVLVEYTYDEDGTIASVRLVDAVTGATYVPAGTVTTCPTGEAQPEHDLVQLCDTATNATVTEFVRDFTRSETGAITGHSDYLLDGTPYTPAGTVGRCADHCQDCETVVLCDLPPTTEPAPVLDPASTTNNGSHSAIAANGVGWTFVGGRGTSDPANWWSVALTPSGTAGTSITFTRAVAVTWGARVGIGLGGVVGTLTMPPGTVATSVHALHTWDPATRTLTAKTGASATNPAHTSTFAHAGPVTSLQFTGTAGAQQVTARKVGDFQLTPVARPFMRTVCRDCAGAVSSTTDTLLDGTTAYVPLGTVGVCPAGDDGQGCTNGTTVLLCDQPAGASGPITSAITDATSADVGQTQFSNLPGPYTSLWSGGSLVYPAGTGPAQQHAQATGRITAVAPAGCEASDGTLTVSVRVTQNGPGTGQAWDGALRVFRGTTLLGFQDALTYAPPGYTKTLTVSVPVTAADLTSGQLFVGLPLETFHGTAKQWTADQFSATVELADCASSESVQFLRTVVTDCETGEVVTTSDTTLDGAPYTVTGDVGQCAAAGGDEDECCDTGSTLTLCDVADDGASTPFLRHLTYTPGIATPAVADFALDGTTPYTVAGTVGTCSTGAADEPGVDTELIPLCVVDNTSGGILQRILAEIRYDHETGARLSVNYVDPVTWGPVAVPGGARIDVCPADEAECPAQSVIEACRCDDTDGDGLPDVGYVELLAVDCEGILTSLGTFTNGLTAPYTPVSPVDCTAVGDDEGADPPLGVQAHRVELAAGADPWDASALPVLQSVTAVAHGGTATITTVDGPSTLHTGEAATWSVAREVDAALTGPLTITADTGTVTVTWTQGVTLS